MDEQITSKQDFLKQEGEQGQPAEHDSRRNMRPSYKGIYLSYYECEFYPVHTRDHKRCSSRFGIFESGITGYNGTPEQGDPQEPQRFPSSKLWYLDG